MIIVSSKRNLNHLVNDQRYAHKLAWNAWKWHDLVGLTVFGQWTNLLDQSPNGQELATDVWQDSFHTLITEVTTDNIVMWATRLSIGFIPRLRLCLRPCEFKITLGWSLMYLWKPNICHHWLDVQETNVSIPQFHWTWNCFVGCWIANGRTICSRPLGRGNWSVTFNKQHCKTPSLGLAQGNLCGTGDHSNNKSKTETLNEKSKRDVDHLSNVDYVPPTHIVLKGESQLYIFEDSEAVIKMITKNEVQQWDTCPEPKELRLIGCSTESSWTTQSKSTTLISKTNSQTQREVARVTNGTTLFVCATLWIFRFPLAAISAIFFLIRP